MRYTPVDELRPSAVRPAKLVEAIRAAGDLRWAIAELPDPPPHGSAPLEAIIDRLAPDDPQWWSRDRAEYFFTQLSDRHRDQAERMIRGREVTWATAFRRVRQTPAGKRSMAELRTDGLAGCLRTPKGGSGRQILFEAGRGEYRVRLLNPDECARLMGAGGYRVTVTLNQALFGFGDAVCVDAVAWVAANRLNPVAGQIAANPAHA